MFYTLAAKTLALIHLSYIIFVVLGGFAALRWRPVVWLHVPAAIWGALVELAGWYCPLTAWENAMLRRAGQAGYTDGFIEHYIFAVIYPRGLTRPMQLAIGAFVVIVNAAVYRRLYRMPRRTERG